MGTYYTLADLTVAFGLGASAGILTMIVLLWHPMPEDDPPEAPPHDVAPPGAGRQRPEMPGYLDRALARIERDQITDAQTRDNHDDT